MVDIFIAVNAVQLVDTKLLLLLVGRVACDSLSKYVPVTSIIGWQFPEPDWVPVTFSGAPSSMYPTAWTVLCFGTVHL